MQKKRIVFFIGALLLQLCLYAQDSLQATILLIGDAGELTAGKHPVVEAAKKTVKMDAKTTVIYLGDNLYKTGLPDNSIPYYEIAKAPLDSQIRITGNLKTNIYFIPGNHDWANGGTNGYESILRMQSYIDILGSSNVKMLPRDGCPGPEEVKINDDITLIIMDSQWWLQQNDKPGVESDCPYKTKEEVLTQLDEMLSENAGKLVLFATHHPFKSYGPHGGYFTLKQHIFPFTDAMPKLYIPLPVLGSSYPLTRAVFGTEQDLKHPLYQAMIREVEPIINSHPNVIYVSGHEHTLQLIKDSGYNYIVSGSGSKHSRVSKSRNTLYASSDNGFVTLQVSKNRNVRASVYGIEGDSVKELYSKNILDFSQLPVEEKKDTVRVVDYVFKDSAVISASDEFKKENGFRNLVLGKNYRHEWSTAVSFKMFNIKEEHGGFRVKSLGGGKQTKSLKLEDKNGKEWSLRTIEKDPEKAMPQNLRGNIAEDIVQDMISASDPYAPLVVASLAKAVNIPSAAPRYFMVPDDPALGKYQSVFANKVVTLEDRDPVKNSDTKSTDKILKKFYEENKDKIDQENLLTARLLDMLIGDFDRHADQWKWGTKDTGIGKLYYAVPRDRDQAFFRSNGLLLKYLSGHKMRYLQGFTKNIRDINGLNWVARNFDRFFLNGLNEQAWKKIADSFAVKITDAVIDTAVLKYPPEIIPQRSTAVGVMLKSRRDQIVKKSLKYYRFLSKKVTVTGSNEDEYFHITKDKNLLKLSVYRKKSGNDSTLLFYRRSFDPAVTKELRLYGLNGNDKFEIDPDVSSRIQLRIIGGKGEDTFNLAGHVHNYLYDLSSEKNVILKANRTNRELSSDTKVLEYNQNGFQYNQWIFPQVNAGINSEDGLLLGVGFHSRTFGFRKLPYATDQRFTTLIAPGANNAYQLKYKGQFNQILLKNDLVVNAELVNPVLNNFFGIGNSTSYDSDVPLHYYRVRYKYVAADLLLRKRYKNILSLAAGPTYYHYWNRYEDNKGRILDDPLITGPDSLSVYGIKDYLGLKAKMDITYLDNEVFPTRGITWFTELTAVNGLNENSHALTKLSSDMTIYAKVSDISRVSAVLRAGAGYIFSKQYEYFQAFNLGANNYLRGYRKNRFSGSSMMYGSLEGHFRLFKSASHVLPGDVGLLAFYEAGRVWVKNDLTKKWHQSVGGGLYFTPFNLIMLSAALGYSQESTLFNFTIGTKFNLTF